MRAGSSAQCAHPAAAAVQVAAAAATTTTTAVPVTASAVQSATPVGLAVRQSSVVTISQPLVVVIIVYIYMR